MALNKTKLEDNLASIFTDRSGQATAKEKFILIIEAIGDYANGVLPPSSLVNVTVKAITVTFVGKLPSAIFDGNASILQLLDRSLPILTKGIAKGMLPLYNGIAPKGSILPDLQRAFYENSSRGNATLASAVAIADVIHKYFAKGSATPASGFAVPPISSWAISSMPIGNEKGKYTGIKWRPEDSIGHPNANALRQVLRSLNYGEKGIYSTGLSVGELSNGGDITNLMYRYTAFALIEIANEIPELSIAITGGNDIFHQNLGYVSNHTRGNAIDFVISPAGNNNVQKVEDILHGISGSPSNVRSDGETVFRFINEYTHLSAAGTADHFHMTVHPDPPDDRESTSRAARSIRLVSNNSVRNRPFA